MFTFSGDIDLLHDRCKSYIAIWCCLKGAQGR